MMPVLIVDDSREDAALARRVMCQIQIANPIRLLNSGDECVAFFRLVASRSEGTLPCLVLLDLSMNPTSGIDVLRELHGSPAAHGSIFIMLSGVADYKIVREGYQLGAATFLVKPLRPDDVLRTFNTMRGLAVQTHPDGIAVLPTHGSDTPAPALRSGSFSA